MDNKACINSPPVLNNDYQPQGQMEELAGSKAYVIHPQGSDAKIGILVVYDGFGYTTTGKLGVDMISSGLGALAIQPDFMQGSFAQPAWFPPNEETAATFKAWREKTFGQGLDRYVEHGRKVVSAAREKFGIDNWGIVGYCWGGKAITPCTALYLAKYHQFAVLDSKGESPYKASIQVHPALLNIEDAKAIAIPHRLMASKDEPVEVIAQYEQYFREHPELQGESETYKTQGHGWAASRADFDDPENKKEFERAYEEIVAFFRKHV